MTNPDCNEGGRGTSKGSGVHVREDDRCHEVLSTTRSGAGGSNHAMVAHQAPALKAVETDPLTEVRLALGELIDSPDESHCVPGRSDQPTRLAGESLMVGTSQQTELASVGRSQSSQAFQLELTDGCRPSASAGDAFNRPTKLARKDEGGGLNPGCWGFQTHEDKLILDAVVKHGHKWREIAKLLPGRTGSAVRNRYALLTRASSKQQQVPQSTRQIVPPTPLQGAHSPSNTGNDRPVEQSSVASASTAFPGERTGCSECSISPHGQCNPLASDVAVQSGGSATRPASGTLVTVCSDTLTSAQCPTATLPCSTYPSTSNDHRIDPESIAATGSGASVGCSLHTDSMFPSTVGPPLPDFETSSACASCRWLSHARNATTSTSHGSFDRRAAATRALLEATERLARDI